MISFSSFRAEKTSLPLSRHGVLPFAKILSLLPAMPLADGQVIAIGDSNVSPFADATGGAFYLMDAEHNVARVVLGKLYVDFAELRGTLEQDLATRDLTVNAMARPLGAPSNDIGNVIDPFHGLTDLRDRHIRVVSDGSFHDPVRMLRAVRLAGELGMTVEPHTESLIQHNAALLAGAVKSPWWGSMAMKMLPMQSRQAPCSPPPPMTHG